MPIHVPIPLNVEVRFDIVEIAVVAIERSKEEEISRRRTMGIGPHLTATNSIRDAVLGNLEGIINKFSRKVPPALMFFSRFAGKGAHFVVLPLGLQNFSAAPVNTGRRLPFLFSSKLQQGAFV